MSRNNVLNIPEGPPEPLPPPFPVPEERPLTATTTVPYASKRLPNFGESALGHAFAALRERNIVAEPDLDLGMTAGAADRLGALGYVGFNDDNTHLFDRRGGVLYLGFGSGDNSRRVAATACEVLTQFQVDYTWNGDRGKKIIVTISDEDLWCFEVADDFEEGSEWEEEEEDGAEE